MPFPRLRSLPLLGALALAAALVRPSVAEAGSPFLVVPEAGVAETSPAYRYANMADDEAFAELDRRKVLYTRLDAVPGVRAPIRLTGRLHGVYFHSSLPPEERVTTIFEILDARLALALDDFAAILERHDIDEVVHYTMYRPNVAAPGHEAHDDTPASVPAPVATSRRRARQGGATRAAASPKAAAHASPTRAGKALGATKKGDRRGSGHGAKQKTPASAPEKPVVTVTKEAPGARKATPKPVSGKTTHAGKGSTATGPKHTEPTAAKATTAKVIATEPGTAEVAAAKPAAASHKPAGHVARRTRASASLTPPPAAAPTVHKTSWAPPGTRHPAGLAIDVGLLHKRDGTWLNVARHFQGHIGDKTCGEGVKVPEQAEARELRSIVCEASDLGVFTYVLTPNYNAAHADHYHMEIKPSVRWFLYH